MINPEELINIYNPDIEVVIGKDGKISYTFKVDGVEKNQKLPITQVGRLTIEVAGTAGDGAQIATLLFNQSAAILTEVAPMTTEYPPDMKPTKGLVSSVSSARIGLGKGVEFVGDMDDVFIALNPAAILKAKERIGKKQ